MVRLILGTHHSLFDQASVLRYDMARNDYK